MRVATVILLVMGVLALVPGASGDETSSLPSWCQRTGESGIDIRVFGERRPGELINRVLLRLQEIGKLDSDFVHVLSKSNVCGLYQKALGLPADMEVCGKSFRVLAQRLNPNLNIDRVPENTYVEVPKIRVCLPSNRGETESEKQNGAPEFRLYVPMIPKLAVKFRERKEWLEERNITIDGWGKAAAAPRPSHIDVNEYLNLPPDQLCTEHKEANLVTMVSKSEPITQLSERCKVQGGHTLMDIIDHSRYVPHPDFQSTWESKETCLLRNPTDADHVSGLLGIIRAQANDRGVLGLYPGIEPMVWWWDKSENGALTGSQIYDKLKDQSNTKLKVTVVASDWLPEEEQALSRFVENGVGSETASLPDDSRLWVVSAGHELNEDKRHLEVGGSEWPQARGKQSNVLVVTGCQKCKENNASVLENSRYDEELVHVAAPAVNVPTTINQNRYGWMQGTSPATAFVAAISAVLADCYPELQASKIKERLQFTSRPLLLRQDAIKLAAGVVDPDVALLDPNMVHLKRRASSTFENVEVEGWCVQGITALDPVTGDTLGDNSWIKTKTIERIVKVPNEKYSLWVFYRSSHMHGPRDPGRVVRIGPGTLGPVTSNPPNTHNREGLLKLKGNRILSLNEIDDIVGTSPGISDKVLDADACKY